MKFIRIPSLHLSPGKLIVKVGHMPCDQTAVFLFFLLSLSKKKKKIHTQSNHKIITPISSSFTFTFYHLLKHKHNHS